MVCRPVSRHHARLAHDQQVAVGEPVARELAAPGPARADQVPEPRDAVDVQVAQRALFVVGKPRHHREQAVDLVGPGGLTSVKAEEPRRVGRQQIVRLAHSRGVGIGQPLAGVRLRERLLECAGIAGLRGRVPPQLQVAADGGALRRRRWVKHGRGVELVGAHRARRDGPRGQDLGEARFAGGAVMSADLQARLVALDRLEAAHRVVDPGVGRREGPRILDRYGDREAVARAGHRVVGDDERGELRGRLGRGTDDEHVHRAGASLRVDVGRLDGEPVLAGQVGVARIPLEADTDALGLGRPERHEFGVLAVHKKARRVQAAVVDDRRFDRDLARDVLVHLGCRDRHDGPPGDLQVVEDDAGVLQRGLVVQGDNLCPEPVTAVVEGPAVQLQGVRRRVVGEHQLIVQVKLHPFHHARVRDVDRDRDLALDRRETGEGCGGDTRIGRGQRLEREVGA